MDIADTVRVVEVGPRDGLQNEPILLPTATKVALIERLADVGLQEIEVGALVHPRLVPAMADSEAVIAGVQAVPGIQRHVLIPNRKGWERLDKTAVQTVSLFTAASESFSQKNTGRSVAEALAEFTALIPEIQAAGLRVRVYLSTVTHCPYEGNIAPEAVVRVAERLAAADELALGETLGRATRADFAALLEAVTKVVAPARLAGHFHDTSGEALTGVALGLDYGLRCFDSAVGGLGGCPFAPGAAGNLATERLVAFLEGQGIATGVDPVRLAAVGAWLRQELTR
ncbi:hydroxymethylglutaryl-CoA lyase [Armatimonas rosea]|uniref:Hydroxymethylglutaryl-CoA lyase n=1 Tax=Armatimonas rosea TaxID=685828 RepID=A0A7W9W8L8_ARMRO|nr:hydroxymethylglutaryl-CoA lyase [Armatimonas rosea]MBB6052908.1 hydroxymethylglutaryl-CoA lyase [Armatimonas rosea]